MNRSCYGSTTDISCEARVYSNLASVKLIHSKFLNVKFIKSLLASFPSSTGLGMSLLPSRVKNVVMNVIPLLQTKTADTAHTGIFASVTRPFSYFWPGPGDNAIPVLLFLCSMM